jgi:hypothetical protein
MQEIFMKEGGKMAKKMAMEDVFGILEVIMMECGQITSFMEMEFNYSLMELL